MILIATSSLRATNLKKSFFFQFIWASVSPNLFLLSGRIMMREKKTFFGWETDPYNTGCRFISRQKNPQRNVNVFICLFSSLQRNKYIECNGRADSRLERPTRIGLLFWLYRIQDTFQLLRNLKGGHRQTEKNQKKSIISNN
jgi:hypothetical protein